MTNASSRRRRAGFAALLMAGSTLGGLAFWQGDSAFAQSATPPAINAPAINQAGLPGFERQNHAFGERHSGAVTGFERLSDCFNHLWPHHDVGLNGVILSLPTACPGAVLCAGVRGRTSSHVDDADLACLAAAVVGQQLL